MGMDNVSGAVEFELEELPVRLTSVPVEGGHCSGCTGCGGCAH